MKMRNELLILKLKRTVLTVNGTAKPTNMYRTPNILKAVLEEANMKLNK